MRLRTCGAVCDASCVSDPAQTEVHSHVCSWIVGNNSHCICYSVSAAPLNSHKSEGSVSARWISVWNQPGNKKKVSLTWASTLVWSDLLDSTWKTEGVENTSWSQATTVSLKDTCRPLVVKPGPLCLNYYTKKEVLHFYFYIIYVLIVLNKFSRL